jgi:hypothetical protein
MGIKPTTTKRTSPPREHTFLLRTTILRRNRPRRRGSKRVKVKRERPIETELSKKGRKSEA